MAFEFGTHFLDELALAGELYDGQEEDIGEMIAFAKRIHTETRPARRALFDNASRADAALLEHLADNLEEVWLDAQLEHSTLARTQRLHKRRPGRYQQWGLRRQNRFAQDSLQEGAVILEGDIRELDSLIREPGLSDVKF